MGFFASAMGLSLAPVPAWLKPTDLFDADDPWSALKDAILHKPESIPLPDQQVDQLQATGDPLLLDEPELEEDLVVPEVDAASEKNGPRAVWTMPPRPRFDRFADRLGLKAAPIDRPCLREGSLSGTCERRALDGFFTALRQVENREEGSIARVIHFGDSLIASDKISDRVRLRLSQRFGSAGRGFLMGKRFNQFQRGQRSGRGSKGWRLDVMTASKSTLKDRHFGFSGASFTAKKTGETLRFKPVGANRFLEIFYLARPGGGKISVLANGEAQFLLDLTSEAETAKVSAFELPEGTEEVVLQSQTRGPRLYGVALEARVPGVIWSSLGLPGATSEVWLRPDEEEFTRLLGQRNPVLAVVMLGGNDGLMLSKKRTTPEAIERNTTDFIVRLRSAVPNLDCLLVSPLEAVRAKTGGRLIPKPEVPVVINILRRVAEAQGCGFWDMYASMGGRGSLKRWVRARLMLGDLIHPKSRGSDLLGEMMAEAIMTAYDAHKPSVGQEH